MDYEFSTGAPITEQEALDQVEAMGFHGLAFDDVHEAYRHLESKRTKGKLTVVVD